MIQVCVHLCEIENSGNLQRPKMFSFLGVVAESVERWGFECGNIGSYKNYTCHFLACRLDWLAQCQDNMTEWDIGSCCWRPDFPVGQCYKVTMSVHGTKLIPILV